MVKWIADRFDKLGGMTAELSKKIWMHRGSQFRVDSCGFRA
jgi:hypothetical protein